MSVASLTPSRIATITSLRRIASADSGRAPAACGATASRPAVLSNPAANSRRDSGRGPGSCFIARATSWASDPPGCYAAGARGGARPGLVTPDRLVCVPQADDFIIETRGLTKEFKGFLAVSNVDLKVRRGQIHALIGPNGAGKTTFFNLLTRFLTPTRGQIIYKGEDITSAKAAEIAR